MLKLLVLHCGCWDGGGVKDACGMEVGCMWDGGGVEWRVMEVG